MDTAAVNDKLQDLATAFSTRMEEFEKILQENMSSSISGPQLQTVKALSAEYLQFKSTMLRAIGMVKMQLDILSKGMDNLETHSRRKVLLFHGIPEASGEQVAARVLDVLNGQMKMSEVKSDCIEACHRLGGPKENRARPILVRFSLLKTRSSVWNMKTALKGTKISVSEFLTKPRQGVFAAARKHFGVRSCWTTDGSILVLLPDKSRRKLTTSSELQKLLLEFPVPSAASK